MNFPFTIQIFQVQETAATVQGVLPANAMDAVTGTMAGGLMSGVASMTNPAAQGVLGNL